MEPSLTKQDIGQLKRDIPKYCATGIFPPDAMDKWETFLFSFHNSYGTVPLVIPNWIIDDFKPVSERNIVTAEPSLPELLVQKSNTAKQVREVNKL